MRDEPLERDIVSALDALDYPIRPASAGQIIDRARARAAGRRWRFGAAAVVMLAASAAAALPGSPLRRWIASRAAVEGRETPRAGVTAAPAPPAAMNGVTTPAGDSVEVAFSVWQDSGSLVVRRIDEPEVRIRSTEFPAGYQVRPAGVLVDNSGSRASYEAHVSSRARLLRVTVSGRTVLELRGGRVLVGPAARGDGSYVISLRPR